MHVLPWYVLRHNSCTVVHLYTYYPPCNAAQQNAHFIQSTSPCDCSAPFQVLVGQLLLDCIKAYNSLMPLVVVLPRQGTATLPPGSYTCTWLLLSAFSCDAAQFWAILIGHPNAT